MTAFRFKFYSRRVTIAAGDGSEATSINPSRPSEEKFIEGVENLAPDSSPIIGGINAYVFLVAPPLGGNVCTPFTTVTEGDLFPGGFVSFGVSSGPGSVTIDHINAGTGLQALTLVGVPVNAVVNVPVFPTGTFNPVVVTFTPINPALPVDFTLRAVSAFHAANTRVRCTQ